MPPAAISLMTFSPPPLFAFAISDISLRRHFADFAASPTPCHFAYCYSPFFADAVRCCFDTMPYALSCPPPAPIRHAIFTPRHADDAAIIAYAPPLLRRQIVYAVFHYFFHSRH